MNTRKLLLSSAVFLVAVLFTACKPILKLSMGIKQPKVKTVRSIHEGINRFLPVKGEHLYVQESLKSYQTAVSSVLSSAPEAFFFSKDGVFIPYRPDSVSCNASIPVFLESIEKKPSKVDTTQLFELYSKGLVNAFTREALQLDKLPEADYYMLITWATYGGKLNKRVANWAEQARELEATKGIRIHPIFLSLDVMYFWPEVHRQAVKS